MDLKSSGGCSVPTILLGADRLQAGKILKIPVIKFLLHSASYLWFLITLLGESITMELYRDKFASRQQDILHSSFHMVWVVGFFWYECKEVWIEGLRSYFLDWWNCLDVMVLSMYLASFALRVLIMLKGYFLCQDHSGTEECVYFTETVRENWHQEDPQLISEVLFAVTSMLSFTRLAYILPAHESLGTLQISIGKMIDDMMRFMFILMIIGTAFLCGINNVYVPYVISPHLGRFNETFHFLFWTMFGVANQDYVDMPQFVLAEFVGRILYGIFTLVIVIVLLNMLIAMITNSFQKIEDDADVEWKFARSKLYLSYFREGLTMPVPFNIIPSPKAIFHILRGLFKQLCCCCCCCNPQQKYPPVASMTNSSGPEDSQLSYRQQVIRVLVQRYIESARREFEETKRKDIGNRITELNKAVFRMHEDLKVVQQILMDDVQGSNDASKDGSSVLGKYIMGAKNNFRGFNGKPDDNTSPLKVTVHHRGEDAEKDGKSGVEAESECGTQGSDCDMVKMEEGRVKSKLGAHGETESKEKAEEDRKTNEEEEEAKAEVKSETTPDEANRLGKTPPGQTGGKKWTEKSPEQVESTSKSPDTKSTVGKFRDIELQETKKQPRWEKGRNPEHGPTGKLDVGESEKRPGTKKSIPSPTGSSSSQDTGFGSQEGEGSIDGLRGNP